MFDLTGHLKAQERRVAALVIKTAEGDCDMHEQRQEVDRDAGPETTAGDRKAAFVIYSWFAAVGLSMLCATICILIYRLAPPSHLWIGVVETIETVGLVLNTYIALGVLYFGACLVIGLFRGADGRDA